MSIRPYGGSVSGISIPLLSFQFLLSHHKMSMIKVAWYVLRGKNIHSWSPLELYVHEIRRSQVTYIKGVKEPSYSTVPN